MVTLLPLMGFLPFVVLFLGLTKSNFKSYQVTSFTFVLVLALSILLWDFGAQKAFEAALEGAIIALFPIIWVIFGAIFTYFVSLRTGAIETIKSYLSSITPDRNIQAVIIAFCFGGFLEAVAGFGSAVAIPCAMLLALGYAPVQSALIALVANSVPVAFGALGIPVIVLSQITQLDLSTLTQFVALQLAPFAILVPLAIIFISSGSFKKARASIKDALLLGALFTLFQTLAAFFIGPELCAVSGSLFSLVVYVMIKKSSAKTDYKALSLAMSNYIILLAIVLITRLGNFPELKAAPFAFTINIEGHKILIDYITTPGTLLLVSAIIGGSILGLKAKDFVEIFKESFQKIRLSAITIISIVALAKVMGYSGMIASVAGVIAAASGSAYPLIAPVIGALGTFVTGSDTSSNILFGELQKQTAIQTGYNAEWIVASNTSGATAGKMISPQSISIAASTLGINDKEGEILRQSIKYCLGYAFVLGVYVFLVSILIF